jgi:hypothetical protein
MENINGEHLFSRWTHKYLPRRKLGRSSVLRAKLFSDRTEFERQRPSGNIIDKKSYCVCERHCNNGWMRKHIDEPAKSIMTPLIQGKKSLITQADQRKIAAWAFLKTIIYEYENLDKTQVTVSKVDRNIIMATHLPRLGRCGIWIGHYVRNTWIPHLVGIPFYFHEGKPTIESLDMPVTEYNSRIFTQVVGQLFFQVIYIPSPEFIHRFRFETPNGGKLTRIWPPPSEAFAWPIHSMNDLDADYACTAAKTLLDTMVAAARRSLGGFNA